MFFNLTWIQIRKYIVFHLSQNEICKFASYWHKITENFEVETRLVWNSRTLFIPYQNHKTCLCGKADRRKKVYLSSVFPVFAKLRRLLWRQGLALSCKNTECSTFTPPHGNEISSLHLRKVSEFTQAWNKNVLIKATWGEEKNIEKKLTRKEGDKLNEEEKMRIYSQEMNLKQQKLKKKSLKKKI